MIVLKVIHGVYGLNQKAMFLVGLKFVGDPVVKRLLLRAGHLGMMGNGERAWKGVMSHGSGDMKHANGAGVSQRSEHGETKKKRASEVNSFVGIVIACMNAMNSIEHDKARNMMKVWGEKYLREKSVSPSHTPVRRRKQA